jgi:hypothetical protein
MMSKLGFNREKIARKVQKKPHPGISSGVSKLRGRRRTAL